MVVVSSYGYKSNGNMVLGMKDNQHYDQLYLLTVTSRWKNPDNHKTPYEQANIAFIFFLQFLPLLVLKMELSIYLFVLLSTTI